MVYVVHLKSGKVKRVIADNLEIAQEVCDKKYKSWRDIIMKRSGCHNE